jgi:NADP-dependent 3-hydroxy acid dehydrogenase YdfG
VRGLAQGMTRKEALVYDPADMSRAESIAAMMKSALAEFGAIDVLVNNAGIQHVAPVDDFPPAKWDAILAINLSAAFHTVRAALPRMKEKGWGRIVNIAGPCDCPSSRCYTQFEMSVALVQRPNQDGPNGLPVVHTVELLDWATGGPPPRGIVEA